MSDAGADNRLRAPLAAAFDAVEGGWRSVTEAFRRSGVGRGLSEFVDRRVADGAVVYPEAPLRALALTPLDAVRVVILGQDPYHGPGQAQGLAFSVGAGQRPPPSLRNILAEVRADTGAASVCRDELGAWARQGVLLLNTCLSVEDGAAHSHARRGWEVLTDALIAEVAAARRPCVFLLWGAAAQSKAVLLDASRHRVLAANHPSPLSARRPPVPFVGCRHFSRANAALAAIDPDGAPIVW